MSVKKPSLSELRRDIDDIDTRIHDLLMRRGEIAQGIGAIKGVDGVPMRPGREAMVLRRLIARHSGPLPKALIVRIWREIFAAVTALQGSLAVAVYAPEGTFGYRNLARDQFGWRTPITAYRSAAQVLEAVAQGRATVGVLPIPTDQEADPWWRKLARGGADVPRIVARLPFAVDETSPGDDPQALAIAMGGAEKTGEDRSFLVLETQSMVSRSHLREALGALDLDVIDFQVAEDEGGHMLYLIETAEFVADDDPRLITLAADTDGAITHVWVVGGFAVPLRLDDMADSRRDSGGGT